MVEDVYFLTVHDLLDMPGAPEPVNATVVHARTFLHPALPQPDAGRIYRCLTEFPGRTPGCLVPLSTLHYELDDGRLWEQVADWYVTVRAVMALTQMPGSCGSLPLALSPADAVLLAGGPYVPVHAVGPRGLTILGTGERRELISDITANLPTATGDLPLWPGAGLIQPPKDPRTMPYQPHGT